MTSFVTGGAGFIGSNLVDALLDRGDRVVVVDDLSTGRRENLEPALQRGAVLHEADIRDAEAIGRIVGDARPAAVFHLAAQADVRKALADPGFDAQVNVGGTINLLESARAAGVGRFVYASTGGALYGESESSPLAEDAPVRPLSAYGQSKFAGEGYCGLHRRLYGLSTVVLRLGNVYGPRQDPRGEAGVIAIFCGKLRDGGRPTIYGDGTQTRDYLYVGDAVGAMLAAAGSDAAGPFNIGNGLETSVLELVEGLQELSGAEFEPEFAPARPGEVLRNSLEPSLAERELGWRGSVSLAEGLRLTLASVEE